MESPSSVSRGGLTFGLLYSNAHIQEVVVRMAEQINFYYDQLQQQQGPIELVVVCVLKGAFMFYTDLVRHIRHGHNNQFIRVQSYEGLQSTGQLQFTEALRRETYEGKCVLLVDDIHDTGRTIRGLVERVGQLRPKAIDVAVLVVRPDKPVGNIRFRGMECSDFILGYGLDLDDWGRNLKDIYQKVG